MVAKTQDDRLETLAQTQLEEERAARSRDPLQHPTPLRWQLPPDGKFVSSQRWLDRLYVGERIAREKKPMVLDHLRCAGPWMVSVDEPCGAVLDGMSQTATVCDGFAPDPLVRAYDEGELAEGVLRTVDPSRDECENAERFKRLLREQLAPLDQVSFANSGAEANERALGLALRARRSPKQTRVLAFEGGFHGRTLLTLHATANPSKRAPYELPGYEACFAPFPTAAVSVDLKVDAPAGLMRAAAEGKVGTYAANNAPGAPGEAGVEAGHDGEPLFAAELESLCFVERELARGVYFACIIEPMQSEGGDRYATARYFRALRLLTSHYQVPMIFDEVQTGFGLGGPFAWHQSFGLIDEAGQPASPDAVTFAKRAQLGVCVSRFEDPEPGSVAAASLARGLIHAEIMLEDAGRSASRIEALVTPRLAALAARYPGLVSSPRGQGYAFAFDLPNPAELGRYLAQRFWRGVVVFGAGTKTVRYRLSRAYGTREVEQLFEAVEASLGWLKAHPEDPVPAWQDGGISRAGAARGGAAASAWELVVPSSQTVETYLGSMVALEAASYEPARREDPEVLRQQLLSDPSVVVVARSKVVAEGQEGQLLGFAIGVPLESVGKRAGPDRDHFLGADNTLYTVSVTVAEAARGLGLGFEIKRRLMQEARARKRPNGEARYRFVSGRSRVGAADAMWRLNRRLGAHQLFLLEGQYGEADAQAIYYRQALGPVPLCGPKLGAEEASLELSAGIRRPLQAPPPSLLEEANAGALRGPVVTKLTLCNYVTPAIVRAVEWVSTLTPEHPHLYLTSSRDECFDKALRVCRSHRKGASQLVTFEGSYFGSTTAAARSASDPAVLASPAPLYDWARVSHPATLPAARFQSDLEAAIEAAGGPEGVLGIFFEALQERSGQRVPQAALQQLQTLREKTGIPLVCFQTASACYRSAEGPFADTAPMVPDILTWWGGAHTGYLHVNEALWVGKPLTMVSTWDGDELSLIREHHQLRRARKLDLAAALQAFEGALGRLPDGLEAQGLGFYRVVTDSPATKGLVARLTEAGYAPECLPSGGLVLAPPLDWSADQFEALGAIFGGA